MATAKEFGRRAVDNTVIGPSILISGKLTGDEDLTVRGRVEGELTLTRTLIVEPSGVVKANVAVKNAIVSGVVVGNINATESVELTREGRMVGDIRAPRVIIVDGASFRGRVDMGELAPGRSLPPSGPPPAPSSVPRCGPPAAATPAPQRRPPHVRARRRRRRGERKSGGMPRHRPRRDRPPHSLLLPPAPPGGWRRGQEEGRVKKKK